MTEPQPQQHSPQGDPHEVVRTTPKKRGFWRFVWRHPSLSVLVALLLLLMVFVGQNMEATSIDFLFWEAIVVPKIVLLFVGVPLGALGWELTRRAFR